jgi:CheY-like chemotaxis protein
MNTSEKKINLPEENFTFLVAEDEVYNYILLKALLENEKIKLIHVTDGLEAVKKCKENPNIDLILMDIKMPVMDGIKAFDEIRKFNTNIPVIAQTAYALEHEKQMLLDKGFNNYISKPIKKAALFSVIKNTLARV